MTDDRLSRVFAALADPTRRDIVSRLSVGDATVGELAAPYDVSVQGGLQAPQSAHRRRPGEPEQGRQRRPGHLEAEVFDLMTKWIERYRQQAEERFRRLDAVLGAMADPHESKTDRPTTNQRGAAS